MQYSSDLIIEPVEMAERLQVLSGDGEAEALAENLILTAASQSSAHLLLHVLWTPQAGNTSFKYKIKQ